MNRKLDREVGEWEQGRGVGGWTDGWRDGRYKNGQLGWRYKFHLRDSEVLVYQKEGSGLWAPLEVTRADGWREAVPGAPCKPPWPLDSHWLLGHIAVLSLLQEQCASHHLQSPCFLRLLAGPGPGTVQAGSGSRLAGSTNEPSLWLTHWLRLWTDRTRDNGTDKVDPGPGLGWPSHTEPGQWEAGMPSRSRAAHSQGQTPGSFPGFPRAARLPSQAGAPPRTGEEGGPAEAGEGCCWA